MKVAVRSHYQPHVLFGLAHHPEVDQMDLVGLALGEQDVGRLEVTVYNALGVDLCEALSHTAPDRQRRVCVDRACGQQTTICQGHGCRQLGLRDELHQRFKAALLDAHDEKETPTRTLRQPSSSGMTRQERSDVCRANLHREPWQPG